jgi:hypothetical protein
MKNLVMLISAAVLAMSGTWALAQSTDQAAQDAAKAARPTGKEAMDAQMNLQKNKPSKAVSDKDKQSPKYRPGGKDAMESQMTMQKNKPSKPVKNVNVPPKPDASKMTPEERAQFRKDVVKEAKP